MATVVTNNFRNANMGLPGGSSTTVDFDTDDIRCSLIDQAQSGALDATDGTYADVNGGTGAVAQGSAMGSKTVGTVSAGVFDSTVDYTFSSVTGAECEYLTLEKYNATDANSTVCVIWDTVTTGLPVTPNSGDITVTWAGGGILTI